jgi:hypothetical protein
VYADIESQTNFENLWLHYVLSGALFLKSCPLCVLVKLSCSSAVNIVAPHLGFIHLPVKQQLPELSQTTSKLAAKYELDFPTA